MSTSTATIDVIDPSTGESFAEVPQSGPEEVNAGVAAARAAFTEGSDWRKMSPADAVRCSV